MVGTLLLRQLEALNMDGQDPRLKNLSRAAHLCLWVMALNAHDNGTKTIPQACYFRGWQHLAAVALHYPEPTPTAKRTTLRTLEELTTRGWINQTGRRNQGRGGRGNRIYQLHLNTTSTPHPR